MAGKAKKSAAKRSACNLEFLINHVLLPPRLPQTAEHDAEEQEYGLLQLVLKESKAYLATCNPENAPRWSAVCDMLSAWSRVHEHGHFVSPHFKTAFENLRDNDSIGLHIKAQNAGVLISKTASLVSFSAFESAPSNSEVFRPKGRLTRQFPGRTVSVASDLLRDKDGFVEEVTSMLSRLHSENIQCMNPTSRKANSVVVEARDTTNPALVTAALMNMLAAVGQVETQTVITKQTREEVLHNDGLLPWRRSPFWLTIKVNMQLCLSKNGDRESHQYKDFMLYLICRISNLMVDSTVTPDVLMIANAKIARRYRKLGPNTSAFVADLASKTASSIRSVVDKVWTKVCEDDRSYAPAISKIGCKEATALALRNSRQSMELSLTREFTQKPPSNFQPTHAPRISCDPMTLPYIQSVNVQDRATVLTDFERWVETCLDSWSKNNTRSEDDCMRLAQALVAYSTHASSAYSSCPRATSGSILTILHLWTALDMICVRIHPLLKNYDPEIPSEFLEPLLLPLKSQMLRQQTIEEYVSDRRRKASKANKSVFDALHSTSFAVLHYNDSPAHKALRRAIEKECAERRERKKQEWTRTTAEYKRVSEEAKGKNHNDTWDDDQEVMIHKHWGCSKCLLENQAKNLSISLDEWALPRDEIALKTVIFELQPPTAFWSWRESTWLIVQDLGRKEIRVAARDVQERLRSYLPLQHHATHESRRLNLCSSRKAFLRSHYRALNFPVPVEKVCVDNALQYQLADCGLGGEAWTREQRNTPSIKSVCTLNLPQGPYKSMQWAVSTSLHRPNEAIARQSECPALLNIREFREFATLRAGGRILWYNVVRELGSSNLSFNSEAVGILIQQAVWEAGTAKRGDVLREVHSALHDHALCAALRDMLDLAICRIAANWKEQHTMAIVVTLALRAMSLVEDRALKGQFLQLLKESRAICLKWCWSLLNHDFEKSQSHATTYWRSLVLDAALTGLQTFDVDPGDLGLVLSTDEDLDSIIQLQILVHDNTPAETSRLNTVTSARLLRSTRIANELEKLLRQNISKSPIGINKAICAFWPGVTFNKRWKFLNGSAERWASNRTDGQENSVPVQIHYNILSGELLADGQPLGQVPADYKQDSLFTLLFGNIVLDVFKSDMQGMSYVVSRQFSGNEVHLGMHNNQMILRTRHAGSILELIRPELFASDLPYHFSQDFFPWLNIKNGEVEFRSRAEPWTSRQTNWTLKFDPLNPEFTTMRHGLRRLLEPQSAISQRILRILGVLDDERHIQITIRDDGTLEAEMLRLKLTFFMDEHGHLSSRELNATVEEDQQVGCLVGLKNRLLLRSADVAGPTGGRMVLVPFGSVQIEFSGAHVRINLNNGAEKRVRYFKYLVDDHLNRLRCFQNLPGHIFQAYLHAITTFCLPDVFTGRTGTEEALSCLREQHTRSCIPLEPAAVEILRLVSQLTPVRSFYPQHLHDMQRVEWDSRLSPLAQHEDFHIVAKEILDSNEGFRTMFGDAAGSGLEERGEQALQHRAKLRNAGHRNAYLAGIGNSTQDDASHKSRDIQCSDDKSRAAFEVFSLSKAWTTQFDTNFHIAKEIASWGRVSGFQKRFTLGSISELLDLRFQDHWGSLYNLCRQSHRETGRFRLAFLFSIIAFGQTNCVRIIKVLLAFAFSGNFRDLEPPAVGSFNLLEGNTATRPKISTALRRFVRPFSANETTLRGNKQERQKQRNAQKQTYDEQVSKNVESWTTKLLQQWRSREPRDPGLDAAYIQIPEALQACRQLFSTWYQNWEFQCHIEAISSRLLKLNPVDDHTHWREMPIRNVSASRAKVRTCRVTLHGIMESSAVPVLPKSPESLKISRPTALVGKSDECIELKTVIDELDSRGDSLFNMYGENLRKSLAAFEDSQSEDTPKEISSSIESLSNRCDVFRSHVVSMSSQISKALGPTSSTDLVLMAAGLWPHSTSHDLLGMLLFCAERRFMSSWVSALSHYAEAIASFQRCERLRNFATRRDTLGFFKEAESPGREGWNSSDHPEWLLLEIENNFTIRRIQATVAQQLLSTTDGNAILQLNMGEGKSSVIIPMISSAMADGKRLARVVILRPLLRQTQSLLTQRLGGLLGRRIYHLGFHRQTPVDARTVERLTSMYKECLDTRGVFLSLPESILSFRLLGLERLPHDLALGKNLITLESWLQQYSRDVLDESDEILSCRFQLVYTVDAQLPMDGSPDRWRICQEILSLVDNLVDNRANEMSISPRMEVTRKEGAMALMRFSDPRILEELLLSVVNDVFSNRLGGLSFLHCSKEIRTIAREFVENPSNDVDVAKLRRAFDQTSAIDILYLLRGLFAHRVLLHAFADKRYLVEYGLDLARCLMAVPYRAKGVPSTSSEFGHPDIAILLTCLSYYYTGLTFEQMRRTFELLAKESNGADEYSRWCAKTENLPDHWRGLSAVNLDDTELCEAGIFPRFKYNKPMIDYFLSKIVFPKEGKEFRSKISCSAWDIPSSNPDHPTIGFSGTNDTQSLLPLSIKQDDLPELRKTNAMVLTTLLKDCNREYVCATDESGRNLTVPGLLSLISAQDPHTQVLIDVGAQILDMENESVATLWLEIVQDAKAAVYFDAAHVARVRDREGNCADLVTSPFYGRLENCLVYLDEAHTRGIDLAVPTGFRAAITLGPRLTKDKLVQGCMRMRRLGRGHSVTFLSPSEVHQQIVGLMNTTEPRNITSLDVLRWTINQTCRNALALRPLWTVQGLDHVRRKHFYDRFSAGAQSVVHACSSNDRITALWEGLREPEARSLAEMYDVLQGETDPLKGLNVDSEMANVLRGYWAKLSGLSRSDFSVSEEHEREVAHEVERERQVQNPPRRKALDHNLHKDVVSFVESGILPGVISGNSIMAAFDGLRRTSAFQHLSITPGELYVTGDFARTVELEARSQSDDFLRPVQWVLSTTKSKLLLIISPYEANALLPRMATSKTTRLHIYSPRLAKDMVNFSTMQLSTPGAMSLTSTASTTVMQAIRLFAGDLYFDDKVKDTADMRDFLGLVAHSVEDDGIPVGFDGFVDLEARTKLKWKATCPFHKTPVPFAKRLLTARMSGENTSRTDMGKILSSSSASLEDD